MVIFRETTTNYDESYDSRVVNGFMDYNYNRFKNQFVLELERWLKYNCEKRNGNLNGFWRLPDVSNLSKIIYFMNGKCSCGHKGLKWCRHEQLYQYISYYMKTRGIFEDCLTINVMKYLSY